MTSQMLGKDTQVLHDEHAYPAKLSVQIARKSHRLTAQLF